MQFCEQRRTKFSHSFLGIVNLGVPMVLLTASALICNSGGKAHEARLQAMRRFVNPMVWFIEWVPTSPKRILQKQERKPPNSWPTENIPKCPNLLAIKIAF